MALTKTAKIALLIAILLLLIPLCCVVFAALSKTTTLVELDFWTEVLKGTLHVGNAGDISGSYDTIIYLEIAYADDDEDIQDGVEVSIEVSYGDDDWTLLTKPFTLPSGVGERTTLDGAVSVGATNIPLITGVDFDENGQKWFILNSGTPRNSESVRTKSVVGDNIFLCHDTIRAHDSGESVWSIVHERIIPIPAGFAFVRVLINNTDIDADIFYTTRLSKVTGL